MGSLGLRRIQRGTMILTSARRCNCSSWMGMYTLYVCTSRREGAWIACGSTRLLSSDFARGRFSSQFRRRYCQIHFATTRCRVQLRNTQHPGSPRSCRQTSCNVVSSHAPNAKSSRKISLQHHQQVQSGLDSCPRTFTTNGAYDFAGNDIAAVMLMGCLKIRLE